MNHAINFEPFSQGNSFHAPQLISLPVNLVELREQNPAVYLGHLGLMEIVLIFVLAVN